MASIRERDRLLRLLRDQVNSLDYHLRYDPVDRKKRKKEPEEVELEKVNKEFNQSLERFYQRVAKKYGYTVRSDWKSYDGGRHYGWLPGSVLRADGVSLASRAESAANRDYRKRQAERKKVVSEAQERLLALERNLIVEGLTDDLRKVAKDFLSFLDSHRK